MDVYGRIFEYGFRSINSSQGAETQAEDRNDPGNVASKRQLDTNY